MKYECCAPTEIRWNSNQPKHWKCEKAKRFFSNPKVINKDGKENNVLSLTLNGVIHNDKDNPIGLSPENYNTYQLFNSYELVFKLIDLNNISTSRVGIVPETGIMSSAYIRFVPRTKMNIKYFYYQYYDWYKRNIFNGLGAGVRQTLSGTDLGNLEILFPPMNEQDQIVKYIDWQVSKINKLIAAKKKEICLFKERQECLIAEIMLSGLNRNSEKKDSGIEWIGTIPEHWECIRCKYLFKERDERSKEGLEQHLSMSQKYGLIPDSMLDERRMLSESYIGGKLCYKNDLILNRLKAHLGVFALAPQDGVISPDYTVLVPNTNKIVPEYAETVLKNSKCRRELCIRVKGVTEGFWRLYTDKFYTIFLPVPPLNEQHNIIDKIHTITSATQVYISNIQKEIDTLYELRQKIISDVVTGQIDVRSIEVPKYEYFEDSAEEEPDDDSEEITNEEEE